MTQEPPQRGERRIEVEYDANPLVMIGYHVPNAMHPDSRPLVMLANLLTGGRTARLTSRLVVRDHIAVSINAGNQPGSRYPRLFTFTGVPIAPHPTQEIEAAVYEELERAQREPPTDYEMQRMRNQVEAGSIGRIENAFSLALQMASSEALYDDWRQSFRFDAANLAVTPEDILRVARTYFSRNNRTVATLVRPARPAAGRTN